MLSTIEIAQRQKAFQRGRCPECGNQELVTEKKSGEITCSACGLVIKDLILDQKPEWRAFTPKERTAKVRVGSPTSLRKYDKGLSTTFQPYRDIHGNLLPAQERVKMLRLRMWHRRAIWHSYALRNLSHAMNDLMRLSDKLHIPRDVQEEAALIYRRALDKGLIRGRSIESMVAAALYAACRLTRTPRSLKTVVTASPRSRGEISRCYRLLQRDLAIKMPIDDPTKYVAKIASHTGLSQKTQNLAIQLLQMAKDRKVIVGKGPVGVAAAALYVAAIMNGENTTQQELAKVAGVTEVTVRNRYKGLDRSLGLGLRTEGQ